MANNYPDWLRRNCSGIDFGPNPLVIIQETERYALLKNPGHWTRLGAHGQEYIAVSYMIVSKDRGSDSTGWYRTIRYGRPTKLEQWAMEVRLRETEEKNTLPDRSTTPRLLITNRR